MFPPDILNTIETELDSLFIYIIPLYPAQSPPTADAAGFVDVISVIEPLVILRVIWPAGSEGSAYKQIAAPVCPVVKVDVIVPPLKLKVPGEPISTFAVLEVAGNSVKVLVVPMALEEMLPLVIVKVPLQ
jgi:hypothetical protein